MACMSIKKCWAALTVLIVRGTAFQALWISPGKSFIRSAIIFDSSRGSISDRAILSRPKKKSTMLPSWLGSNWSDVISLYRSSRFVVVQKFAKNSTRKPSKVSQSDLLMSYQDSAPCLKHRRTSSSLLELLVRVKRLEILQKFVGVFKGPP